MSLDIKDFGDDGSWWRNVVRREICHVLVPRLSLAHFTLSEGQPTS